MQRNSHLLRTMEMCKTRRICNDRVSHKRRRSYALIAGYVNALTNLKARPPTSAYHRPELFSASSDGPLKKGFHPWEQLRIIDHEGHQLGWVAADIEKLQSVLLDKVSEHEVCRQPHTMSISRIARPSAMNGWTSPREPTTWITTLRRSGN